MQQRQAAFMILPHSSLESFYEARCSTVVFASRNRSVRRSATTDRDSWAAGQQDSELRRRRTLLPDYLGRHSSLAEVFS